MKIRNITTIIGFFCTTIIVSMVSIPFTICDGYPDGGHPDGNVEETTVNFSNRSYKPVPDVDPETKSGGKITDNILYKEWCEETFENGNYIYEAYKNIAFNIKYAPEPNRIDFWQTPKETSRQKRVIVRMQCFISSHNSLQTRKALNSFGDG